MMIEISNNYVHRKWLKKSWGAPQANISHHPSGETSLMLVTWRFSSWLVTFSSQKNQGFFFDSPRFLIVFVGTLPKLRKNSNLPVKTPVRGVPIVMGLPFLYMLYSIYSMENPINGWLGVPPWLFSETLGLTHPTSPLNPGRRLTPRASYLKKPPAGRWWCGSASLSWLDALAALAPADPRLKNVW